MHRSRTARLSVVPFKKGASTNLVVDLLIEEQSVLMNKTGGLSFEAQVKQFPGIWGERSVHIRDNQKGKEKAEFFEENPPIALDVPQAVFETHTLVVLNQKGRCKIYTTASNHPEFYEHQERSSIVDVSKQHDFASILNTQMRAVYQTRYKQNQLVADRRQQMALQSLLTPYNRYDVKGPACRIYCDWTSFLVS